MELRQLRAFVKASETNNFSLAAKELFVTQSTFSQCIKKLEEELNVQLFYRNTHDVTLTEVGEELLIYARKTIKQADNCINRMDDIMNLRKGVLNIGVTHSFSLVTSETIFKFIKKYPGIKLKIYYKTMHELMDMLMKREVDFVLSYKPCKQYPQIESHALFDDKLSVIVQENHPFAKLSEIDIDTLTKYPVVLPSKGLQARNILDRLLERKELEMDIKIEMNEVTPLLNLVGNSSFITILSGTSIESYNNLRAIPLNEYDCEMEGSFHILKDSYHKKSTKEFINLLRETTTIKKQFNNWF